MTRKGEARMTTPACELEQFCTQCVESEPCKYDCESCAELISDQHHKWRDD